MLSDLKFIMGAVARKDYVEELCHLLIKDRRVVAYDGLLSMSSPIDIDLHVKPHAADLMRAVQACDDAKAINLSVTPAGRLSVKSGKFKAFVECLDDERDMNQPQPEGVEVHIGPTLLASIKALAPFMSIDASRRWAQGLRICGSSTFATNNIILAEYWHGSHFPFEIILPADAVKEIIRINENPERALVSDTSATFFFSNGRWLRTQLVIGEWPIQQIEALLGKGGTPQEIPTGFFDVLARLKPFTDDFMNVWLHPDRMMTSDVEDDGASIDFEFPTAQGQYNLQQLLLLEDIATAIDFGMYPAPCYWRGNMIRGMFVGKVK